MNKLISHLLILVFSALSCFQTAGAQDCDDQLNLGEMLSPLTEEGIFRDTAYYNWGASIIQDKEGLYHLFYSRWKKETTFKGWLTASEVAHAVAQNATGPWTYKETVLQGRGHGYWDAVTAHNPKIKYFEGKYYLYYIATNLGDNADQNVDINITRDKMIDNATWDVLRHNQRTGFAVSNSLNGPWERCTSPILEPSGPIANIVVNPAIAMGNDGVYHLIVKGDKPNEKKFIRNQAIAISSSPIGPFTMQDNPVIGDLDTEDISMWYDEVYARYYAIFHAHSFIGLMTSVDGLKWEKASNYKVTEKKIWLEDGTLFKPDRMERPFVYIENAKPRVLCLAIKKGDDAYTVFISLVEDH